jgi:hypothetical protein
VSSSDERRAAAVKIFKSSLYSLFPESDRVRLARENVGRADSSRVNLRLEYIYWSGMGRPSASVSSAFLDGAVGNGTRGITRSDNICCPATPNFVKHSCVKAWVKIDQLSVGRSRIGSDCVVGRADSMVED